MDEPTNDLAATVQDQGPVMTLPPASAPASLFVDAEPALSPQPSLAQPTPTMPALPRQPMQRQRTLQLAPWFAGAIVLIALLVIASIGDGDANEDAPTEELGEQPIVFDPDEAEAYLRDGSSGMPPIVVTPLPDAGAVVEEEPETTPATDTGHETKGRRRHRRSKSRKDLGTLEVRTRPNSDVLYRKAKLGRTPLTDLPLKAGRYQLTFVSEGLSPVKRNIVIRAGETTKLKFDLED